MITSEPDIAPRNTADHPVGTAAARSGRATSTSDHDVVSETAARVAPPREAPGDSFVLHAPLEVLARAGLLRHVAPADRGPVVERIAAIGDQYETYEAWSGDERTGGRAGSTTPGIADAAAAGRLLVDSIGRSDFEGVDDAVRWLGGQLSAEELVAAVVDPIVPSLAAAGHGAIFLRLLPRVAAANRPAAAMLRTTAHELARHPDWRIEYVDDLPEPDGRPSHEAAAELALRLRRPVAEPPESHFIMPTMRRVEETGLAREVVADLVPSLTVADARRVLLRTAAMSMLLDDPAHAPYGWSHCLTMPQATLGVAGVSSRPQVAIAVAATYVLGFRATQGTTDLDVSWAPSPVAGRASEAPLDLDAPPSVAAAQGWHTPPDHRPPSWRQLAAHAGGHHDAHLAKYTLACVDAARDDATAEHVFLAAAAFLNAWWRDHDR